ncbi:hypothetical protein EBT25_13100 [bacterium]|jgi:hypothetical protein|nr:hypothetical protein [bacterium]
MNLSGVSYIQITGERVTFDRTIAGWIATGWEKGLPICRKPMTEQGVLNTLLRYKNPDAIIMS